MQAASQLRRYPQGLQGSLDGRMYDNHFQPLLDLSGRPARM
jgi:hypothetical protein